jgi:excisionase family DNA binding protein
VKKKEVDLKFLNVEIVAEMLSHTPYTIRKWAREKKIKSIKVGNRILFKQEWIDSFLKKIGGRK